MWSSDTLIRLVEVGFVLVVAMLLLVPTLFAFNWLFRHLVRIANPGQLACHYGSPQAVSACPRGRAMAAVCQLCYADKQFASYYELIDASHLPMHVLLSWVRTIAEHLDGDASPLMSVDTWHRYATRQRWYQAATWHPYHIDWYAPELAVLWGCVHLWLRRYGTRPPSRQLLQHIATKACPKGYLRPYFEHFAQQPDKCEDDAVQVSINIGQLVWNNNGTLNQHTTTMTEDQRNHPLPPLVQGNFVNNGQFAYENTGTMNFNAAAQPATAATAASEPSQERLAHAVKACQTYFWAGAAYAVLYCILRDDFHLQMSRATFEQMMQRLPGCPSLLFQCTPGTLDNAFSRNAWLGDNIDRWDTLTTPPPQRVLRLRDALRQDLACGTGKP